MTMFKKNGGFTLVELIVVIAILAILAGVAIPAYSGYITKAQDAAVVTELDAIATAAQAANSTAGAIAGISIGSDGQTITVTFKKDNSGNDIKAATYEADFSLFYAITADNTNDGVMKAAAKIQNWDSSSYKAGATWTNGQWSK